MTQELQADYLSGKNVYFLLRNSAGQVWNGSAFATYQTVNYSSYPITATEQGTASGYYVGTFPAVSLGVYNLLAKERAGVSPAETDVTVGTGVIQWTGSAIMDLNALIDSLLKRDVDNVESSAAVHSLATVILKLVSKFDAFTGTTFRTDGTTIHMTQNPQTDGTMIPIRSLGVGV